MLEGWQQRLFFGTVDFAFDFSMGCLGLHENMVTVSSEMSNRAYNLVLAIVKNKRT
jgi:hypothetical protein